MKLILVTRQQMEACSRALPKKVYRCRACQATYPHDRGWRHATQECLKRKSLQEA
jgi:hypothetical protein